MKFYDLHIHVNAEEGLSELIKMAERLGYSGIGITEYWENKKKFGEFVKKVKETREKTDLDLVICAEIKNDKKKKIKKSIAEARNKAEVILIQGGDFDVNRMAVESSRVDFLSNPEFKRTDSGIDQTLAQFAAQNKVAIEINFSEVLQTFRKIRSHVLSHMRKNIMLGNKYGYPIVITSGAKTKWEMRDPRGLAALGQILGMDLKDSINSLSTIPENMIETNRKKISGKIKYEGVEEVE